MNPRRNKNQLLISAAKTNSRFRAVSPNPTIGSISHWSTFGLGALMVVLIWVVFGQTLKHQFINYDDDVYVYENPVVIHGLTWSGVKWAFTHTVSANWHPVTMMSHMLDCQLYGLWAGGHHLTNVFLHILTAVLLFLVLVEMTGASWRSAFVATVFAIHPLRVESVAWVAERKDLLSGFFFMLTLWAYVRYVRRPFSTVRYLWVLLLFTLGLMAKPMIVTLPFILLLLDYWPLNRFNPTNGANDIAERTLPLGSFTVPRRLVIEKIPLLILAVAACAVTVMTQSEFIAPLSQPLQIGTVSASVTPLSISVRMGNAAASYLIYLGQTVWPARLAAFYSYSTNSRPLGEVAMAFILLAAISAGAFFQRRRRPYFLIGWLWYLGMLVPVIGFVQVGMQGHADRYTYLPQIGLCLALTWTGAELLSVWRHRR